MTVINQPTCTLFTDTERFTQLSGYYEAERHTVWMMLRAQPRPCFNHALIEEIMNLSWLVRQSGFAVDFWVPDRWFLRCTMWAVTCSSSSSAFRTVGEALRAYARACVDCVHAASRGLIRGPSRWQWSKAAR
jgi:DSF synthase